MALTGTNNRISRVASASIAIAIVVMGIKYLAYWVTGSVALYSDALESIVNVLMAVVALVAIRISTQPPDKRHPFGHHKAEYFSAVLEGALIIVAAILILREAYFAVLAPGMFQEPLLGLVINGTATVINTFWAWYLTSRGRIWRSPALAADGHHLWTDVLTSLGVLGGLALAVLTGWQILDPLLAAAVAVTILWTGYGLTMQSMSRLLDEAAGPEIVARIRHVIRNNAGGALQAHDIRTRHAGRAIFIEFHLVVPGAMTVAGAHDICDRLEDTIEAEIEGSQVVIHVEPEVKATDKGAVDL